MVYVYDAGKCIGIQSQTVPDKGALEISHAGHTCFDTIFQYGQYRTCKCVNSTRNITTLGCGRVAESMNIHIGVSFYIERLLVIDEISYGPYIRREYRLS